MFFLARFYHANLINVIKTACPSKELLYNSHLPSYRFCVNHRFGTSPLNKSATEQTGKKKLWVKSLTNYIFAAVFGIAGLGFAFVPLFNAFCSVTNYAGTLSIDLSRNKTRNLKPVENHELTINFIADKSSYLRWNFRPLQADIKVAPGETVLAFYTAENPTDEPISGISTYNVVPYEAAKYFNKIQCFCFDEQRLNPREQVDMPVFFYIDTDIIKDPYLWNIREITLSYTFFEAIEGLDLPFMSKLTED